LALVIVQYGYSENDPFCPGRAITNRVWDIKALNSMFLKCMSRDDKAACMLEWIAVGVISSVESGI